jgi:phosphopantothenoylcysteine decarboxylase/phosphopantothenate--cysteine ligase
MAAGIADDILTTTVLVVAACRPVLIAPAMNTRMFENPVVQRNIETLRGLGYRFVEPEEGYLACGDYGKGKMAEPATIVEAIEETLAG